MSNTTITQLSQSALTGVEKLPFDNGSGTFHTTMDSMSLFVDKSVSSYTLTSTISSVDRMKVKRSNDILSFQPGTSILKDVSSGSNATSTQIVMGSDTRLSDSRIPLTHSHSINNVYLLQSQLDNRVLTSSIGVPSGVASLDGSGKVPLSQLPSTVSGQVSYIGTWNATSNSPSLSNTSGVNQASLVKGNYYVVSVAGTTNFGAGSITFGVGDWVISNGVVWQKVNNREYILSVAGRSGSAVTLVASDIGNSIGTNFNSTLSSGYFIGCGDLPINNNHLSNKEYVDTKLSLSGGTVTGNLYLSSPSQLQIGSMDRYFSSSMESFSIRKSSNTNATFYDNGDLYIRSKLSVSGSLQTNSSITVGGVSGSDGVVFPDGTTQTTACSSITWISPISLSTVNNNTYVQTLLPSIPITAKSIILEVSQERITSTNGTTTQLYVSADQIVEFTSMLHYSNDGNSNGGYVGQGMYPIFVDGGQCYIYLKSNRNGNFGSPVVKVFGYI